jgi:hypothetical protein
MPDGHAPPWRLREGDAGRLQGWGKKAEKMNYLAAELQMYQKRISFVSPRAAEY